MIQVGEWVIYTGERKTRRWLRDHVGKVVGRGWSGRLIVRFLAARHWWEEPRFHEVGISVGEVDLHTPSEADLYDWSLTELAS